VAQYNPYQQQLQQQALQRQQQGLLLSQLGVLLAMTGAIGGAIFAARARKKKQEQVGEAKGPSIGERSV